VLEQVVLLLENEEGLALEVRKRKSTLKTYYLDEKGGLLWIGEARMPLMIQLLKAAEAEGLFANDYPTDYLQKLLVASSKTDEKSSAFVELLYSAFFLKYSAELKGEGRVAPRKVDKELYWHPKEIDLVEPLRTISKGSDFKQFISGWEPQIPHYKSLKAKLTLYRQFEKNKSWTKIPNGEVLKPGMDDVRVPILRKRLSGERRGKAAPAKAAPAVTTEPESTVYDEAQVEAVKYF
jgi:murein L,D-transpeptidase YcbB/YkuD